MSNQKRFALVGVGIGKIDKSDALVDGDILVYNATTTKWETKQLTSSTALVEAIQDTVGTFIADTSEIDFTYNDAGNALSATLINNSIAYARIVNASALSVLGRSANSSGVLADIAAAADGDLLNRNGTALVFGQSLTGAYTFTATAGALTYPIFLSGPATGFALNQTSGAVDNRLWDAVVASEAFKFRAKNDAGSSALTWLQVERTDTTTIDSITLTCTTAVVANKDLIVGNATQLNAAANRGNITSNGSTQAIFQWGIGGSRAGYLYHDGTNIQIANAITGTIGIFTTGNVNLSADAGTTNHFSVAAARATLLIPINLKSYTVATLPAGTQGDTAYVTDATVPTYNAALVGGGAVKVPVFYNGAAWVSH